MFGISGYSYFRPENQRHIEPQVWYPRRKRLEILGFQKGRCRSCTELENGKVQSIAFYWSKQVQGQSRFKGRENRLDPSTGGVAKAAKEGWNYWTLHLMKVHHSTMGSLPQGKPQSWNTSIRQKSNDAFDLNCLKWLQSDHIAPGYSELGCKPQDHHLQSVSHEASYLTVKMSPCSPVEGKLTPADHT